MPVSHGNTRDSKLDTTPAVQARLTAGEGQPPRVTGRNLARLSRRRNQLQVRRLSPRQTSTFVWPVRRAQPRHMHSHRTSRCQPSNYDEIDACRVNATKRIIVAAACHSKDTGGFVSQGNEMYLDVMKFRHWQVDRARMRLTVGAGVKYMDVAPDLAASQVALPAYGNYGGQTIIGAMSTSTALSSLFAWSSSFPSLSKFASPFATFLLP